MLSVSFSPIGPWPLVAIALVVVAVLTVWAYRQRLRGTTGRWRWLALGLRLAAVLLCLLAAVRPSIVVLEKKKQTAGVAVLVDLTGSMAVTDEAGGKSRADAAWKTLTQNRQTLENLGPNLEAKLYRFDATVHDLDLSKPPAPDGRETALGASLLEVLKRQSGQRLAAVVLLSDGASNSGTSPLAAAQRLKGEDTPIFAVGFGTETAGEGSRDIAVKVLNAGPTVFVKNQLQVRGVLNVRGFARQPIDVELLVDGERVATKRVVPREGRDQVPVEGFRYIPQDAGEKMVTLRVKPRPGELVTSNNQISTFVTVLRGGINVLYLQGPNFSWEHRFLLTKALDASPDIQADGIVLRKPATEGNSELKDADLAPGHYDAYILGDLPANHLTERQQRMLVAAVQRGAGLIMLGGRSSFGAGGWADTELTRILPTEIHPGDGQMEPEGGIKMIPALDNPQGFVIQLGPTRTESARIWEHLPPLTGANRLGPPKLGAQVLAMAPDREPLMVVQDMRRGRVLAFAGETWVWFRASDESRAAYRKFWRQAILWSIHKEDSGGNQVKLALSSRRVGVGQKLDLTATARDAKGAPLTDVQFETQITYAGEDGKGEESKVESVEVFNQGENWQGMHIAKDKPGVYRATVRATRNGENLGSDSVRFLVYQDDRELENPAADRALLRQIAEATGGKFLVPEELGKQLRSFEKQTLTEYMSQTEHRVWDNWPFFLIFTALLTGEWALRKRHGWV